MSEFSKRVKLELSYLNKTQADLARFLNVSQSSVQQWLQKGSIPAADTALKIARFLNVPLEYLIDGTRAEERKSVHLSDYEKRLLEESKELTQEDKAELLAYIAMKKSMYKILKADNGNFAIVKDC
jgi:transcriptional regulator with XRE-family HTH domain